MFGDDKDAGISSAQFSEGSGERFDAGASAFPALSFEAVRAAIRAFPITSFLLLAFLYSWGCWFFLAASGFDYNQRIWKLIYVAGLSGPLMSSLCVSFAIGGMNEVRRLAGRVLIWKFSPVWYALALLLAPALMLAAMGLYGLLFHKAIELPTVTLGVVAVTFGYMILRGGPANEELGWRGFVLPRLLERHSPLRATAVLAPIWAVWHWPLWLLRGLPHRYWPFLVFFLIVAPLTVLFTWLHLRTGGSVLAATLFHGSVNTAIHFLPALPPRYPGLGPFGLWIAVTWAVALLAIWFDWRRWLAVPGRVSALR